MPRFEWDPEKALANLRKHLVAFEDAALVWSDPLHRIRPDRHEGDEERWQAIGLVAGVVLLLVVHTLCGEESSTIGIISARKATRGERREYEHGDF